MYDFISSLNCTLNVATPDYRMIVQELAKLDCSELFYF